MRFGEGGDGPSLSLERSTGEALPPANVDRDAVGQRDAIELEVVHIETDIEVRGGDVESERPAGDTRPGGPGSARQGHRNRIRS